MDLEHERRLAAVEERSKSNSHRLEDVERRQNNLDELVGTVKALAVREENVESVVTEIKSDVKSLKGKPAQKWDNLIDKIVWAVAAAVIAFLLSKIGL